MGNTVENIVVGGPSAVTIAAYGGAKGTGTIVGITEGGLKLNWKTGFYFPKADQFVGKVKAWKIDEDGTAEVTLAEVSLVNLALALGYPSTSVVGSVLKVGGLTTVTEKTVYIDGPAPGSGTMEINIQKCIITGAVEISLEKSNQVGIKLMLQILEDTSKTIGERGIIVTYSATDTTPPTIAMTAPAEDGTVVKDAKGTVTLTITDAGNPIDESTIVEGKNIIINNITDQAATVKVLGAITYVASTKVITFTPSANWTASAKYQIIATGITDLAGNELATVFLGHFTATA